MEPRKRLHSGLQPPAGLRVGEPREPSEMPPVGAGGVASEPSRKFLRGIGTSCLVKPLAVFEPRLEVTRRGLHHHRWFIPLGLHAPDTISSKVIDQAQPMDTCRADVNVRALEVLAP